MEVAKISLAPVGNEPKMAVDFESSTAVAMVRSIWRRSFRVSLPAAARFAGLGEPEIHEYKPSRFPGYVHANTLGGQSALTKYRSFRTWVFRLP